MPPPKARLANFLLFYYGVSVCFGDLTGGTLMVLGFNFNGAQTGKRTVICNNSEKPVCSIQMCHHITPPQHRTVDLIFWCK